QMAALPLAVVSRRPARPSPLKSPAVAGHGAPGVWSIGTTPPMWSASCIIPIVRAPFSFFSRMLPPLPPAPLPSKSLAAPRREVDVADLDDALHLPDRNGPVVVLPDDVAEPTGGVEVGEAFGVPARIDGGQVGAAVEARILFHLPDRGLPGVHEDEQVAEPVT